MSNQPILGVIFDMDGVLCDSEEFICLAAQRMFRETYGVDVPEEDFLPFVGAGEDRYVGGPGEKHRLTMDLPRDKARTYELYLEVIRGRLPPLPGVLEFIAECRRRDVKCAVATAADHVKMAGNLREIGVPEETFDAIVTGSDVERKKPHPDAFLLAAERLDLPADRCLVVEDAPNGCQAATAAGATCLGLTTSFPAETLTNAGARWTAPHLGETPADVYESLRGEDPAAG
ncbi:MAG: HAD family hydrolase [Phycisphaerae bacterium]